MQLQLRLMSTCIAASIYIDLNMVRARCGKPSGEWAHSGYREIQEPPKRYVVIDS